LAMQFTARKDWMSRVGVSPKSALADKLKAFRGARIGASTIGGGPAQYTRYLARTAGIDPEHDMKILAVGFGAARMAALRTKQVDVTVGDAPEADQVELEGFGELFLNCSQRLEGEVGIDRLRAVAGQAAEVMDFARLARLDHEPD